MRILSTILISLLTLASLPAFAFNPSSAVNYLKSRAADDWSVMALASAGALSGVDISFLNSDPGAKATDIEKRILARAAAGISNNDQLINQLTTKFNGTEIGGGDGLLNDDIFGLLALAAHDKKPGTRTKLADFIRQNQNNDGGWGFAHSPASSDSNDTAMAVMALLANGESRDSALINKAFEYINTTKAGFGYAFSSGFAEDTASTAWVVSALNASARPVAPSTITYLNEQQQTNGSFVWQGGSNGTPLMTAFATVALNNDFYPVKKKSGSSGGNGNGGNEGGGSSPTNPSTGNVGGRVVDQFGNGVAGVTIDTCHHGNQMTNIDGRWEIALPHRSNLCARVASLPAGWEGATSINNTPETQFAHTYEFQLSGIFCRQQDGCAEVENEWDIADDLGLNFQASKTASPTPPAPPPVLPNAPEFNVAIISPAGVEFAGPLSFSPAQAINTVVHSGINYKITDTSFGPYVEAIAGFTGSGTAGWMYAVNGTKPGMGAAEYVLQNGDEVIWFFDNFDASPPPFPGDPGGQTDGHSASNRVNLTAEIIAPRPPEPEASVSIQLSKSEIKIGESVTLTWSSANASQVLSSSPDNWAQNRLAGSLTLQPMQTTTYSLTVGGSPQSSASVTVAVDRTPSVVFGVSVSSVDFGQIQPGQSSSLKNATLENSGGSKLEITATLLQNTELFRRGLKINSENFGNYRETLTPGENKNASLMLEVPSNYSTLGVQRDTLIFWARVKTEL